MISGLCELWPLRENCFRMVSVRIVRAFVSRGGTGDAEGKKSEMAGLAVARPALRFKRHDSSLIPNPVLTRCYPWQANAVDPLMADAQLTAAAASVADRSEVAARARARPACG